MAATSRIRWTFEFFRREGAQRWTTTTHLDTPIPDQGTFEELVTMIVSGEGIVWENCFNGDVEIVKADYYPPGEDIATFTHDINDQGSANFGSDYATSDSVSLWRWTTTQRTTKNHPVYLFNYVHGVFADDIADHGGSGFGHGDFVHTTQREAQQTFAQRWVEGWVLDTTTWKRAGPNGAVAQAVHVEEFIHHRDFPR